MSLTKVSYAMIYGAPVNVLDKIPQALHSGIVDGTNTVPLQTYIQAAIDASPNVYMPEGTYLITSTIYLKSYAGDEKTLRGAGKQKTIIIYSPTTYIMPNIAIWCGNHVDNIPSPIYQCEDLVLSDFGLKLGANATHGIRIRESRMASVKRIKVDTLSGTAITVANAIGLLMDGCMGSKIEQVELLIPGNGLIPSTDLSIGNSSNLATTAGSASGAGATSAVFDTCWFINAALGMSVNVNSVQFVNCVIEANAVGAQVYAELLADFTNCYFEANVDNCIVVNGIDTRNHGELRVTGGFYNSARSGMTQDGAGYAGYDAFVKASYANRIHISGVQMVPAFVPIGSIVHSNNCSHIEIDANPFAMKVARRYPTLSEHDLTNALATTAGTKNITVTFASHGLAVGATIGLRGFTTPINGLPCNLPFYQVTSVINGNSFVCTAIPGQSVNAVATSSGLGGTGYCVVYDNSVLVNCMLDQPEVTLFNDCDIQRVDFSASFTTPPTSAILPWNGQPFFITDSWTYLLYSVNQRSVAIPTTFTNYSYIILSYPSGYEQGYQAGSNSQIPASAYTSGGLNPMGVKVPPGTKISVYYTSASASPSSDTRSESVSVFIVPTGYRDITEA